jgi:serine/threonine protein kinase
MGANQNDLGKPNASGLELAGTAGPAAASSAAQGHPMQSHPMHGDVVAGRYTLAREIARGGMGAVFEGKQRFTGRTLAVKLVPSEVKNAHVAKERLLREAKLLGALRHAAVVDVHDAGVCAEHGPYVAMEMLEGKTLDGILAARSTLTLAETLWIAARVGEALSHAHRRGVIHRDVKPTNIFVCRTLEGETIKLIDFGIAGEIAAQSTGASPKITRSGDVLGTFEYMAPEQLTNAEVTDPRSDQHSLAVVLLECLTGHVPAIADRMSRTRVPDLAARGVPHGTAQAIFRALSPSPVDRFDSMGSFLQVLLGNGEPSPATLLTRELDEASRKRAADAAVTAPAGGAVARRRFARAPYITPVRVHRANGTFVDGRTEDISEGGLLVILPQTKEAAEQASSSGSGQPELVRARFALPTNGQIVDVVGKVRWIRDARGRAALGIEFDSLTPDVRKNISLYVDFVGTEPAPASLR